jgi:hypothetical protein
MPGDPGYSKLPTQGGDLLAIQEPGHELELLVHLATLLPRHSEVLLSICQKL